MPTDLTLTFIVFLPLVGAVVIMALPVRTDLQRFRVRTTALFATALPLLFAAYDMLAAVTSSAGGALPQPTLDAPWLRGYFFQIDYHLGTDGLNLMLLLAVSAVFPALVLASWRYRGRYRSYFALLLLVEVGLNGAFATQDLLLFLIFFWWPVVPLSLLVSFGQGARAAMAGRRLLLIQSGAALTLLAAVLLMLFKTGNTTFNFQTLSAIGPVKGSIGLAVGVMLVVAFGVRMAVFPFQRWFVEAISAAPTPVGMLVTVCSLPVGGYGLVRILLDIDPRGAIQLLVPLLALALLTLYWGAIAARGGRDLRRVVANSLVASGGPVLLGVSVFSETSIAGALGICFAYVFFAPLAVLAAGAVCDRAGRARLRDLIGVAASAPRLRLMYALAFAALIGVPLLAGFPGLFQVLVAAAVAHRFVTAFTVFGLLLLTLAAWRAGTLVFWTGPLEDPAAAVPDSHGSEFYAAWLLGAALVVFGISSGFFVPYTVRGTDLVAARVSSLAPPAPPVTGTKSKK